MTAELAQVIIDCERDALERWCRGDPSGFLEVSASDVVYFDPFIPRRLDGLDALTAYYEGLRGTISASRWKMLNPDVKIIGDAAVLTFNFVSWSGNGEQQRWNCTEVYRRKLNTSPATWRIVQTHWSFTGGSA